MASSSTTTHPAPVKESPSAPGMAAKIAAEAFGTFWLVFGGLGVGLLASAQEGYIPVALAFGLAVVTGALAVGHISGGHFNPAVTIGVFVSGRFKAKDILPYIAAQLVGGILAMAVLYIISMDNGLLDADSRGQLFSGLANTFGDGTRLKFGIMAALLIEVIVTAVFVAIILGVTSPKAPKAVNNMAPFAIGLALAVLIQVALPFTNASLNPARSTAAAIFAPSSLGQLWLFWVAPIAGAVLAGLIYRPVAGKEEAAAVAGSAHAEAPLGVIEDAEKATETKIDALSAKVDSLSEASAPSPASVKEPAAPDASGKPAVNETIEDIGQLDEKAEEDFERILDEADKKLADKKDDTKGDNA